MFGWIIEPATALLTVTLTVAVMGFLVLELKQIVTAGRCLLLFCSEPLSDPGGRWRQFDYPAEKNTLPGSLTGCSL